MLKKFFDISSNSIAAVETQAPRLAVVTPPMVAVVGAKGGVGATSIAINLAAALSMTDIRTTIVDANLQQPDVANMIGKEPEHSFMEMLNRKNSLDRQIFEACSASLSNVDLPLNFLSPPLDGSAAFKANLSELAECLSTIRTYSQFWVLDLPRHIDKHLVNIIDMCDKILLVFEATVQSVATCRRWLNIFNELGYSKDKIICVLNRSGSKYTGVEQQLTEHFSGETIFRIPNASSIAWECSIKGTPIVLAQPNHKYSQAMLKLAQALTNRS
jgi:pilus assembly protein CpaE